MENRTFREKAAWLLNILGLRWMTGVLISAVVMVCVFILLFFEPLSSSKFYHSLDFGFMTILHHITPFCVFLAKLFVLSFPPCLFIIAITRLLAKTEDSEWTVVITPLIWFSLTFLFVELLFVFGTPREILGALITDVTGISQFILFVFFVGCVMELYQLNNLYKEFGYYKAFKTQLLQNTRPLSDFLKSTIEEHFPHSIILQKVKNMVSVLGGIRGSDYPTLISFTNHIEFSKKSKLNFIVKILPILGLIGTVLGFTLAVLGLQQAANSMANFSDFRNGMIGSLVGMKTAFMTTLIGMISMSILLFFSVLISEAQSRMLIKMDEFLYIAVYHRLMGEASNVE